MQISVVLTKIKRKIESNKHLDNRSKQIILHIMRQVFKEIPREDLIDSEDNIDTSDYKGNPDNIDDFKDLFGDDIFKEKK